MPWEASRILVVGVALLTVGFAPLIASSSDAEAATGPGTACDAIEAQAPPEDPSVIETVGPEEAPPYVCAGIRPGSALVTRIGPVEQVTCTLAFIFTDGAQFYASTAGHCVSDGEVVQIHGVPGFAGQVAFRLCGDTDSTTAACNPGEDFALIEIDEDKESYIDPAVCAWGPPEGGVFTSHDSRERIVKHFGWGLGIGGAGVTVNSEQFGVGNTATQAREGLAFSFETDDTVTMSTVATTGDSGSPVLTHDLTLTVPPPDYPEEALGVLTHITSGGTAITQRLDVGLAAAEDALGTDLELVGMAA